MAVKTSELKLLSEKKKKKNTPGAFHNLWTKSKIWNTLKI